ncbi:MAG: hypothetical protein Q9169_006740, partial [Polycauliona sp. 2 TL-2023]
MDPFSVSVGVAGLLALAAKTIQATKSYCHEARHAKEAASELLVELDVLHWNLSQLDRLLRHDTSAAFSNTSVLATSTHGCRTKLSMLHEKLDKAAAHPMHRLLWPLRSDEHQKTVQELRAFTQWIQFALTIDGSSLLAKTSQEVIGVLTNQLQMFQLLGQADTRAEHTHNTVMEIQQTMRTAEASRERERILDQISNAKPGQKHHHVRLPRVEATGEWLLEEDTFSQWRDGDENILWCYGIQGSGKSILADQEYQSLQDVIASLLKQVVSSLSKIPEFVTALYDRLGKQQQSPLLGDLVQALSSSCREHKKVYIIIDALDECIANCRSAFLHHLKDLEDCAKVFVTSRPYPDDIREAFKCRPQIEIKAHRADLEKYITARFRGSDIFDDINDALRVEIVGKIIQSAQGMFLLAVLHVQTVCNEPTIGDMEDALEHLPQDLHAAFEDTMQRIRRQSGTRSNIALQALRMICRARRPMLLGELQDALAFRPNLTAVDRKYRPSPEKLVDACHGLVTIDEKSQIIRLVHFSVHRFLLGNAEDLVRDERVIAKLCIDYQMLQPFASGCCQDEDEIIDRVTDCPFIKYASFYWGFHLLAADDSTIDDGALHFLRARPQLACSYQIWQYEKGRREEYWEAEEAVSCNPLHMAATFGLDGIASKVLPLYAIDEPTHMGTTALMKAASCGHRHLVSLFMNNGADPEKHNWYGTVLHGAAEAGEIGCIHELLDRGVNVDIKDDFGRTPLVCAADSSHVRAMHALLERGADVNIQCNGEGTLLYEIVEQRGPIEIIQMLLAFGADPNTPGMSGLQPLHITAMKDEDNVETARMLLDYRSNLNAPGWKGRTPFQTAAAANNIAHMQLFLDRGADIDAHSIDYKTTALSIAVRHCNTNAVQFLLDKGANLEIADVLDITPLGYAKIYHFEALEQMLLDAKAKRPA